MTLPRNKKLSRSRSSDRRPIAGDPPKNNGPKLTQTLTHEIKGSGKRDKDDKGSGKGSGKGPNNGSNKSGGKYFGARGGYEGVSKKKVRRLVNGVLRDEIKDLRREKAQIRRDLRHQTQQARRDYRRGKGDLEHVFGETGDYISFLGDQTQQTYEDQSAQSAAATAALQQQIADTYSGANTGVNSELARLGIEGGANLGGLASDQANAQSVAAQTGLNAQTTMGMASANSSQLMNLISGMNQGSYMSAMGQNLNNRNDNLTEINRDRQDNFNAVRDAIRDVKGSRKDMFFQLLNQLQETGWSQYMDQQQLNLAKRNARHARRNS